MGKTKGPGKITLSKLVWGCVAIGLVAGLVVLQRNADRANQVKGAIARIEEFQAAVDEFHKRYAYLPGDIPAALAAQLHLTLRDGGPGRGDGNGKLEGINYLTKQVSPVLQTGEPFFFWEDLSSSFILKEQFDTAIDGAPEGTITKIGDYLPEARFGKGNYVYVYSHNKTNYFGLSRVRQIEPNGVMESQPGLTVAEAYAIDNKMCDGYPLTGKVTAKYINRDVQWSPSGAKPSPSTCYDTTSKEYSTGQDNGAGVNCALSFELISN